MNSLLILFYVVFVILALCVIWPALGIILLLMFIGACYVAKQANDYEHGSKNPKPDYTFYGCDCDLSGSEGSKD